MRISDWSSDVCSSALPFGKEVRVFTLPGWMAPDVPADAKMQASSRDGTVTIRFGDLELLYDSRGLTTARARAPDTRTPSLPLKAHRQSLTAAESTKAVEDQVFVDAVSDRCDDK